MVTKRGFTGVYPLFKIGNYETNFFYNNSNLYCVQLQYR